MSEKIKKEIQLEIKGNFRDVKVFYNGEPNGHIRSKGNEIKSIIIEVDEDYELLKWENLNDR